MPTAIEWADETFNPWWGCDRVSPACAHCYADDWAKRFGKNLWGPGHQFRFFGDDHWAEPLTWARTLPEKLGRRPRVFCASMADVFEERWELLEHRRRLFALIDHTPELDWLILTKRPEFARWAYSYFPNVWLGVSIENARYTWRADVLRDIPAAVRFVSAEPLLGSLVTMPPPRRKIPATLQTDAELEDGVDDFVIGPRHPLNLEGIDWVIVGGESGPKARPFELAQARELIHACRRVPFLEGPAVFVKQLGAKPHMEVPAFDGSGPRSLQLHLHDRKGGDPAEWPTDLRIREFPTGVAVPA